MQVKQGHAGGVSKLKIKGGVNLSVIYRTLYTFKTLWSSLGLHLEDLTKLYRNMRVLTVTLTTGRNLYMNLYREIPARSWLH